MTFQNKDEAAKVVGGLSDPSKMPCWGYSLPASECKTGSKIAAANPNSICGKCYAKKYRYMWKPIQKAMRNRLKSLYQPHWSEAMVFVMRGWKYFRWHDSGDIQSVRHLRNIVRVCRKTPDTKHWLPTREYKFVADFIASGEKIPDNLTIRLSASQFDGKPPEMMAKQLGVCVSGASKTDFNCPASLQNNACGDCRACWDKSIFNITYKKH